MSPVVSSWSRSYTYSSLLLVSYYFREDRTGETRLLGALLAVLDAVTSHSSSWLCTSEIWVCALRRPSTISRWWWARKGLLLDVAARPRVREILVPTAGPTAGGPTEVGGGAVRCNKVKRFLCNGSMNHAGIMEGARGGGRGGGREGRGRGRGIRMNHGAFPWGE